MHYSHYDVRLAAYAVIVNSAGEILLTWYNGRGRFEPCWTLPGGGVEFDESLADAVVREVYEEAGYHVTPGRILAEDFFTRPAVDTRLPLRSQRFVLEATIVGGALGTTETDGSTDFAEWVPLAGIPDLEPRAGIIDLAIDAWPAARPVS